MKKKDRYYIINRVVREWNEDEVFDYNFKPGTMSKHMNFFKHADYSCENYELVEDDYCCYGMWVNCWEEPEFEGNWDMTAEDCKISLLDKLKNCAKDCRRDKRFYVSEGIDRIDFLIVLRDKYRYDYRFSFRFKDLEKYGIIIDKARKDIKDGAET